MSALDVPPTPPPAPSATPDLRSTSFQAVQGGPETHDGNNLMVTAYAVLWVILMVWLLSIWRKQAGLHTRIDELEKTLDRAASNLAKK